MKVIAVIQARMGSTRLPGKSLLHIAGVPLLQLVIERVKQAKTLDAVILATSVNPENDLLCSIAEQMDIIWHRGSEEDVLSRFIEVGKTKHGDVIVRICADNPLVDPDEIDRVVTHHMVTGADYSFNNIPSNDNGYPDGLGAEVISAPVLYDLEKKSLSDSDREHVTQYIIEHPDQYHIEEIAVPSEILGPDIKLDIDTPEDYSRLKIFIEQLPTNTKLAWKGPDIVKAYREYFRSKIVIIFEKPEHVIQCPACFWSTGAQTWLVATAPGACWELEKRGLAYAPVERYYDNKSFYNEGLKNYQVVEEICHRIDIRLKDLQPCMVKYDINAGTDNFVYFKVLYDSLMLRTYILDNVIRKHSPDLLIVFRGGRKTPDCLKRNSLPFPYEESIFSILARLPGWNFTTAVIKNPEPELPQQNCAQKVLQKPTIKGDISQFSTFKNLGYYFKNFGFCKTLIFSLYAFLTCIRKERQAVLLNFGYNWNYLLPFLYRKGYHINTVTNQSIESDIEVFKWENPDIKMKNIESSDKKLPFNLEKALTPELFEKECTIRSINFTAIFKERIVRILYPNLLNLQDVSSICEMFFAKNKIDMIFCGPKTSFTEQVFARIARYNRIPVLCFQHGALGHHYAPIMLFQERQNTNIHFLWGKGVKTYIENSPIKWGACVSTAVGSYELEQIADQKPDPGKKNFRIIYVTTSYYLNDLYVSHPDPIIDNEYWVTQRSILGMLGTENVPVALKLHPSEKQDSHIYEFISKNQFDLISVYKNTGSFKDLMIKAEVVVIDWPTTSLLQAVATQKPVFVLLKHILLTEHAIQLLQKRAFCYHDINEFCDCIRDYIKGDPIDQHPDVQNTEFLEEYGIVKNDGRVVERVFEVLDNLTEDFNNR
jgi:spore coat polysaccharide biosynthesis protein SpsF (cytidylyltransferase family)